MILVTGASGFIGRTVHQRLSERQAAVRAISRNSFPNCLPIGDISESTDWSAEMTGVQSVVHLAARVHVGTEQVGDPLSEYRRVNAGATLNLGRQAARAGVKRMIFVSSIAVNGNETRPGKPFTEEDAPNPLDNYGISKLEAERGLSALSIETGLEIVTIRPPLVYGRAVPSNFRAMMVWLSKGLPLPFASVSNRRSLVSVENLTDLIIRCLEHPAAANQIFLAADGNDLSTPELLRRVGAALGYPARLFPFPATAMRLGASALGRRDVARRLLGSLQVDIAKARRLLDWAPPQGVDEAIVETARDFLATT